MRYYFENCTVTTNDMGNIVAITAPEADTSRDIPIDIPLIVSLVSTLAPSLIQLLSGLIGGKSKGKKYDAIVEIMKGNHTAEEKNLLIEQVIKL